MTNQEIFDLLDRFERGCVRSLRITRGDFSLEMSKDGQAAAPAASEPAPLGTAAVSPAQQTQGGKVITAPLAGVFYAAHAPGEKPYVSVGDRVEKGQTVCLMEAMKMISEIPAPCNCIITEILKENGKLAAFGEPIFRYTPC